MRSRLRPPCRALPLRRVVPVSRPCPTIQAVCHHQRQRHRAALLRDRSLAGPKARPGDSRSNWPWIVVRSARAVRRRVHRQRESRPLFLHPQERPSQRESGAPNPVWISRFRQARVAAHPTSRQLATVRPCGLVLWTGVRAARANGVVLWSSFVPVLDEKTFQMLRRNDSKRKIIV